METMPTPTNPATPDTQRSISLPTRVIVSLRAGAVLAIANILCVAILSWAWVHAKAEPKALSVTGSAKKVIQSDLIVWSARVNASDADLVKAYESLRVSTEKVQAYLKAEGVPEAQITISSVGTTKRRAKDQKGNDTEKVIAYELGQDVTISSGDVKRISEVARKITTLIKDGVMLDSESPRYIYTKLADLKIDMLAQATKDATARARQIATNAGSDLGGVLDAKMGVLQINPMNSNEVSSLGNNDQTSLDKEITAVVTARFSLK